MRELVESTEESALTAKTLITAMGLSEDEYWNIFKPKYETAPVLIKETLLKYCTENGIAVPDLAEAEYEIVDTEFFEELDIEY